MGKFFAGGRGGGEESKKETWKLARLGTVWPRGSLVVFHLLSRPPGKITVRNVLLDQKTERQTYTHQLTKTFKRNHVIPKVRSTPQDKNAKESLMFLFKILLKLPLTPFQLSKWKCMQSPSLVVFFLNYFLNPWKCAFWNLGKWSEDRVYWGPILFACFLVYSWAGLD